MHEPLRAHFADSTDVEVVVEGRARDRRSAAERRCQKGDAPDDRRRIRAVDGRRVAERRAAALPVDAPILPRRFRGLRERLAFVERLEPSTEQLEDRDTARLVTRFQAGERDVFSDLYMRYFDRVYSYLRVALRDDHDAEDGTQQVFTRVFEALRRYERRGQPFRAWLFRIVRNYAVDEIRKRHGVEVLDPEEIQTRRAAEWRGGEELASLDWVTDKDLLLFIERLPVVQRQVLMLRYMLDLRVTEVAEILGRTPNDVSALQHRALVFLRERLEVVRRGSRRSARAPMTGFVRPASVLRRRRYALAR
jgi:RNA polymerase sigma-70 factor (ECF subfamily)